MTFGIVVGANARQEWLLSWWWNHYTKYNNYPVVFVDFGLSKEKKEWCRERGELLSLRLPPLFVQDRDEVSSSLVQAWEGRYPDGFWEAREAWFKKAAACLHSPFLKSVWIDLDCEIVKPLEALEKMAERPEGIAMAVDRAAPELGYPIYNSGVIVFQKKHPLIEQWAQQSLSENGQFRSDQDLLSWIIADQKWPLCELSPFYNWGIGYGMQDEVAIYHWIGDAAKALLRNQLILDSLA